MKRMWSVRLARKEDASAIEMPIRISARRRAFEKRFEAKPRAYVNNSESHSAEIFSGGNAAQNLSLSNGS